MKNFLKIIYLFSLSFLFFIFVFSFFAKNVEASTGTIDSTYYISRLCSNANCTTGSRIAWRTTNGEEVIVSDSQLTGNLWGENIGWINLNPTNSGVKMVPEKSGILSGYAWGQNVGWVNFKPTNGGVTIDTDTGEFNGYAWAQNYGWIKFDCNNPVLPNEKCVKTTWRPTHTTTGSTSITVTPPSTPPTNPPVENPIIPPATPPSTPPSTPPTNPPVENPIIPPATPPSTPPVTPTTVPEVVLTTVTDGFSNIIDLIINGINSVNGPLTSFLNRTFTPPTFEKIKVGLRVTTATSAIVATGITLATALLLTPLATPELLLIPLRLWSLLLTGLGLRKKTKPWGIVYDSVTKQPLDPVYVSLKNLDGNEVSSCITDLDGRYGFLVPPGVYKVVPGKTNYIFPSAKLADHINDELYPDLYFGDYLNVAEGETIAKNIPMDALNFDWNEFAKNKKQIFNFYSKKELIIARFSSAFFIVGAVLAVLALFIAPEPYNLIIFGLYVLLFVLRRITFKKKARGKLTDKNNEPLSFALVRVFSANTNVEIAHKVADKMGRYFCLIPNGQYYVQIENKNPDESYSVVYKSETIEIKNGILNKVFNV